MRRFRPLLFRQTLYSLIMKVSVILLAFFSLQYSYSQRVSCYSLEEAMVDPTIVKELILRNQGLSEIPEEISKMNNLEVLDLAQNNILEIHQTLDLNTNLKELNLSNNIGLSTVSASDEFFELPLLMSLELANNGVSYLHPKIGNLKNWND